MELNAEGGPKVSRMLLQLNPEASLVCMLGCIAVSQGKRNSREIFYLFFSCLLGLAATP